MKKNILSHESQNIEILEIITVKLYEKYVRLRFFTLH